MMNEVANLIKEIDEWVTKKKDAITIASWLIVKFNLTLQDFVTPILKDKYGKR
jgi:hypothetical protein